jgi:hypothetical protein
MLRLYVQQNSKQLTVADRTSTRLSIPVFITEKSGGYEEIRTEYRNKIQVCFNVQTLILAYPQRM